MRKKLVLDVNALSVDTFDTAAAAGGERGTVHGAKGDCTCAATCVCPTAIFHCAEIAWTVYSCDYTQNNSCYITAHTTCTAD
jgi:hypothetical protein